MCQIFEATLYTRYVVACRVETPSEASITCDGKWCNWLILRLQNGPGILRARNGSVLPAFGEWVIIR